MLKPSERISEPKSVGELMQMLYDRIEANGGYCDAGDFVYRFTPNGTFVWPKDEFDETIIGKGGK